MLKKQEIHGANRPHLLDLIAYAETNAKLLWAEVKQGKNQLLTQVSESDDGGEADEDALNALVENWQGKPLVLIGIGGSLFSPNLFVPFATRGTKISTLTAPEPRVIAPHLTSENRFLILSKSGTTAETMAIFLHLLAWAQDNNLQPSALMAAVCEDGDNPLRALCQKNNIPCFDAVSGIDSRFSLWTNIGMVPAALFGLDGAAIRAGASEAIDHFFNCVAAHQPHPLFASAAWNLWGGQVGRNIHVMVHSDKRLEPLLLWWQQIFAESLGKNGLATTPLLSKLPEDLHIRFQLYLDGPDDKIFTILTSKEKQTDVPLKTCGEDKLKWLEGAQMSQLLLGQEQNAIRSLTRAERPMRLLSLDDFSAHAYGALTAHFVLDVLLTAKMWGVPAFGQPAIEQGKKDLRAFIAQNKV